eukprot:11783261-Alexandrium_andersonii.AAC.1
MHPFRQAGKQASRQARVCTHAYARAHAYAHAPSRVHVHVGDPHALTADARVPWSGAQVVRLPGA